MPDSGAQTGTQASRPGDATTLSSPRKRGPRQVRLVGWIPAFAGMTGHEPGLMPPAFTEVTGTHRTRPSPVVNHVPGIPAADVTRGTWSGKDGLIPRGPEARITDRSTGSGRKYRLVRPSMLQSGGPATPIPMYETLKSRPGNGPGTGNSHAQKYKQELDFRPVSGEASGQPVSGRQQTPLTDRSDQACALPSPS